MKHGLLKAAVALAVVGGVIAAALLLSRSSDSPPPPPVKDPQQELFDGLMADYAALLQKQPQDPAAARALAERLRAAHFDDPERQQRAAAALADLERMLNPPILKSDNPPPQPPPSPESPSSSSFPTWAIATIATRGALLTGFAAMVARTVFKLKQKETLLNMFSKENICEHLSKLGYNYDIIISQFPSLNYMSPISYFTINEYYNNLNYIMHYTYDKLATYTNGQLSLVENFYNNLGVIMCRCLTKIEDVSKEDLATMDFGLATRLNNMLVLFRKQDGNLIDELYVPSNVKTTFDKYCILYFFYPVFSLYFYANKFDLDKSKDNIYFLRVKAMDIYKEYFEQTDKNTTYYGKYYNSNFTYNTIKLTKL